MVILKGIGLSSGVGPTTEAVFGSLDVGVDDLNKLGLKGSSAHEDFCGHSGKLSAGDLQVSKA